MQFPNLVYRSPGPHKCKQGGKIGTYCYRQVNNFDDLTAAIKDGFYPTKALAVEKPDDFNWGDYAEAQGWTDDEPDETETPETSEIDAPPTREELEAKARELGISFNGNTKDATLITKINEALEADASEQVDGAPE